MCKKNRCSHDVVAHFLFYQVPPTPKDMGKEKEGRVEKEKPDKKKDKQKPPPPDDEVGLCCHMITMSHDSSHDQSAWSGDLVVM